jgi:hypothetical protein
MPSFTYFLALTRSKDAAATDLVPKILVAVAATNATPIIEIVVLFKASLSTNLNEELQILGIHLHL